MASTGSPVYTVLSLGCADGVLPNVALALALCHRRSKSHSSGKKIRKHTRKIVKDKDNLAPRPPVSPCSYQPASSPPAQSARVLDDFFSADTSSAAQSPAPRVPSTNSIKSGMALASDSMPNVIMSSLSQMLSTVVLDLLPATPLSSPRKSDSQRT
ncbi:hypothetical protein OH76DRAFT_1399962 [Lentinus brumalis]|uniref:Uncharacterized protein n=1 Tax=Lentinus brumalis TaxID=2498619 RepID=A0A371DJL0_9APHY|nr:hypothetical protein OH76DRAFT_1399962 [Polyporus brumalis]